VREPSSRFAASPSYLCLPQHPPFTPTQSERLCVIFSFPIDFQLLTVSLQTVFTSLLPYLYASSMFGKPRQLETEAEMYDVAVRALMRRAHSVHEMKQKLERRSDNKLLVQVVMARLKENGMIDDARYAKQIARQRTEGRKQGKFRVARDLRARGVPDSHIDAALKESAEQNDESATVRQRIERKLRSSRGEIDEKKMASIYSSLLRAGFSADVVRRELKAITREDLPDVEESPE
jgi:regulatory protein